MSCHDEANKEHRWNVETSFMLIDCPYFFLILTFIISLISYASELLQGKIHDLSDRERQVFLRSYDHDQDISILNRVQFVPK